MSAPWATACAQPLPGTKPRRSRSRSSQVVEPVAPLQDLAAGQQRARRCRGRCTRRGPAPRSCAGRPSRCPRSPRPTSSPVAIPSPSPASRSSYTPRSIQVVSAGYAVPSRSGRVGVAEHPGQLGRQVVERAVGRDRETLGVHVLPVRPGHAGHPAKARVSRSGRGRPCALRLAERAVPDRPRAQPHRPRRRRRRVAAAAPGGLADHRRPVLRRPGAVAARPRGQGLLGGRPDAADDRPDGVRRRRGRHLRPGRSPAADRRGVRRGPAGPRGRPGVARRRAGAGRDDPGAARRPGDRGHRPQHQPARRTHAEPAGAVLPADRGRPDPDDRARLLPGARPAQRPRRHARGSGDGFLRVDAAGRVVYASPNALSVYRRLGLSGDLTGLSLADTDPRAGAAAAPARRGDAQRGARRPGAPRHRDRHRRGGADRARRSRCARRATTSARWCWCATSPTCAGATASWSPRTPPSARSTTG